MGFVGDLFAGNKTQQAAHTITPEALGATQNFDPGIGEANRQFALGQNMLLQQANGLGPNPALEQLKQTTDMNARQAQGMIASQKGLNPALAARLGAQTAAQTTQQATGQAAELAAQQQMAAQQQYGQNALGYQNMLQQALAAQNVNRARSVLGKAEMLGQSGAQKGKGIGGGLQTIGDLGMMAAGAPPGTMKAASGGVVSGHAKVSGDSPENDTVPALLSPGEIVIPRTAAKSPDHAKAFIDALMSHKEEEEPTGYARILKVHKEHEKRLKKLEARLK